MNSERIADFDYHLPEAQIAQVAIEPRDAAKLLVYTKGAYSDSVFNQLPQQLPSNAHLVFNNAKVIQARLFAKTQTHAKIEVFLLKPHQGITTISLYTRTPQANTKKPPS